MDNVTDKSPGTPPEVTEETEAPEVPETTDPSVPELVSSDPPELSPELGQRLADLEEAIRALVARVRELEARPAAVPRDFGFFGSVEALVDVDAVDACPRCGSSDPVNDFGYCTRCGRGR